LGGGAAYPPKPRLKGCFALPHLFLFRGKGKGEAAVPLSPYPEKGEGEAGVLFSQNGKQPLIKGRDGSRKKKQPFLFPRYKGKKQSPSLSPSPSGWSEAPSSPYIQGAGRKGIEKGTRGGIFHIKKEIFI